VQFGKYVLLDAPLDDAKLFQPTNQLQTPLDTPACHLHPFLPPTTQKNLHASRPRLVNTHINLFVKMAGYNVSPMSSDELEHALHPFYPVGAIIKGWSIDQLNINQAGC
jgi:hypothetical protein